MANQRSDPNDVTALDDLSLATVIALIERLRRTETADQFLCREIELDEAVLEADYEMRTARDSESAPRVVEHLGQVRTHILSAHDYVGDNNIRAAIEELNKVVELKIGL